MTTANKGLVQPSNGSSNWDTPLNDNFGYIDKALGGLSAINATGVSATPVVLTLVQYQNLILSFSGTLTANVTYLIPSGVGGEWIVKNATTGAFTLTISNVAAAASTTVAQGETHNLYSDGSGVYLSEISPSISTISIPVTIQPTSAATNTVTTALTVDSQSSGTPAAGIGVGLAFAAETAAGTTKTGMLVQAVTTDVTGGTEDFDYVLKLMAAGAAATEIMRVTSTGVMTLNGADVISGRIATGTPTQSLALAGVVSSTADDGSKSSGTYTPSPVGGNFKKITNGGAFNLAAPTAVGDYTLAIQVTNASGAGAITLTGFNKTFGNVFTTVVGDDFFVSIMKVNGFVSATVQALQ